MWAPHIGSRAPMLNYELTSLICSSAMGITLLSRLTRVQRIGVMLSGPAFSTLGDAIAGACWSLPFTILSPGLVWLWSRNSDHPEPLTVREDTWWDPSACTFRDLSGEALPGPWIPALRGVADGLHMLSPGGRAAVHVLCAENRDGVQSFTNAFLPGPDSRRPPPGWRWHPGIAHIEPDSLPGTPTFL